MDASLTWHLCTDLMAGGHLKRLTDTGKSPEARECSVCLRNSTEASTTQREQKVQGRAVTESDHEEHYEQPGRGVKLMLCGTKVIRLR